MTVPFKQIPQNLRVPFFFAELDNSKANSASQPQRTLLVGQILAAAAGPANIPVLVQSVGQVQSIGGLNSMLDIMHQMYRAQDSSGEVWVLPVADPGGGVAATGSFTFTASPTAPGVLSLYIAGTLVQLSVAASQSVSSMATALAALINSTPIMPVSAVAASGAVNLTALNVGIIGDDIDIRVNYGGNVQGQATPAGLTYTIVAMANGTLTPTLTTALANLGSQTFDFIVTGDQTTAAAMTPFLNDTTGRWSWQQALYGHCFNASRGSAGTLTTYGLTLNDQHQSCMGFNDSPNWNVQWSAAVAGAAAVSLRNFAPLPVQTLPLIGILPPPVQSRFSISTQNTLLYSGIATFSVDDSGTVRIQNLITTYQKNAFSQPDNSYLEIETMFTLMFVLRFMKTGVTSTFGQKVLAANGTVTTNPAVVTPNIIRAYLIALFQQLEDLGYVQNSVAFAANIDVEQNAQNPNRVDVLWPGTLVDQLRIFALLAQFRLQ